MDDRRMDHRTRVVSRSLFSRGKTVLALVINFDVFRAAPLKTCGNLFILRQQCVTIIPRLPPKSFLSHRETLPQPKQSFTVTMKLSIWLCHVSCPDINLRCRIGKLIQVSFLRWALLLCPSAIFSIAAVLSCHHKMRRLWRRKRTLG